MENIMTPVLPPEPSYWRHPSDQILAKFQVRTAPTVSIGKRLSVYQNEVTVLASSVNTHPLRQSSSAVAKYFFYPAPILDARDSHPDPHA